MVYIITDINIKATCSPPDSCSAWRAAADLAEGIGEGDRIAGVKAVCWMS
jgi:hypothetical protein